MMIIVIMMMVHNVSKVRLLKVKLFLLFIFFFTDYGTVRPAFISLDYTRNLTFCSA